jgi:uroporphyrinogen-III synthase
MRLIITRPADDANLLKAKLEALGHSAILVPLLQIIPRANVQIPSKNYQLICVTSANAVKHCGASAELKRIPVLTVGPQSLEAARAAGFKSCEAHGGDVAGLASYVIKNFRTQDGPLLYLAGAQTTADLQAQLAARGFTVDKVVVYDAIAQGTPGIKQALAAAEGVLLYSPRSARIWVDIVTKSGLETTATAPIYFCLSENVAKMLPPHWQTRLAKTPDEAAMLALLD